MKTWRAWSCRPGRNRKGGRPGTSSHTMKQTVEEPMPLYMYQAAYTPESWSAQLKNPQNRVESVGRQVCEAVGGKLVGGWLCFGEYDLVIIADVPNNEAMAAI